jgi:hypothetical protein
VRWALTRALVSLFLHALSLKQIKPEYFEESGTLRLLSDKVRTVKDDD